VSDWCALFEAC
jgi:hypothetical protein